MLNISTTKFTSGTCFSLVAYHIFPVGKEMA